MPTHSAIDAAAKRRESGVAASLRRRLLRKLWLPKFLYESLPYLYAAIGLAALGSAVYLPGWTWILPYLLLVGLGCLHAGLGIATMRYRYRRRQDAGNDTS